jgi:hypothetical protein
MTRCWVVSMVVMVMGVVGALASTSRADEGKASTWVRLDGFTSTRMLDDSMGDASITFGLKNTYELGSSDRLKLDGGVLVEPRGDQGDVRVAEALWQHSGSWLDLRIGQQRINWGKADGINPTDFFTPRDFTVLQPMESDQRRSVPVVRADAVLFEGMTLSLVGQQLFVETRVPTPSGLMITTRAPDGFKPQAGLRLSSSGDDIDWSICVFHGYLKLPLLGDEIMAGAPALFWHYPKLDAAGGDIAHNFGKWGFRAEAAWLAPSSENGWSSIRHHGFLVTGVDRGGEDWNVNVQAVARYTPGAGGDTPADPADPAAQLAATVASQNAINYGQAHRFQLGFTSRLALNWLQQTLQTEVLVVGYFQPSTFFVRPVLGYAVSDADRITLGGELYVGRDASFFGQFARNRTAFVEYQHFF